MTRTKDELLARIRKQNAIIAELKGSVDTRFAELDAAAVESWPSGSNQNFVWMLDGAGWEIGQGPIVGVFEDRPKGERCLWSCSWDTSQGLYDPDKILPLEHMTMGQLQAEILDVLYRARLNWCDKKYKLLMLYLDFDEVQPASGKRPEHPGGLQHTATGTPPEAYRWQITKELRGLRAAYPGYTCPFAPPPKNLLRYPAYRPGWPDQGIITPDWEMPLQKAQAPGSVRIEL